MKKFDCPTCHCSMDLRTGKYGDFFYCRQHGTISVKAARGIKRLQANELVVDVPVLFRGDPLNDAVKRTGMMMGHHHDDVGQLIDWFNDDETRADWDEDHWLNVRPY